MDIGEFIAHETILRCDQCKVTVRSAELSCIVSSSCNFGFDIIEFVGRAMFIHCRNEKEIQEELRKFNVSISIRGIGCLARKFITYLAILHREAGAEIKLLMNSKGGYILHLDGTCEDDSPHLFCALDSISEIVLGSIKIPSESAKDIIPLLERVKQEYGDPVALVHDMGQGIAGAVAEVFPKTPDFICHFHFLRDVGVDLLATENTALRKSLHEYRMELCQLSKELKRTIELDPALTEEFNTCKSEPKALVSRKLHPKVFTYALLLWIQDAKSELDGYGFPFDRAHLATYERLQISHGYCQRYQFAESCPQFLRFQKTLSTFVQDQKLTQIAHTMQERTRVFENLRTAMRIAEPRGRKGLNSSGEQSNINTIRQAVTAFRQNKKLNQAAQEIPAYRKLIEQLDRYWDKLFTDPITVKTSAGQIRIQPQRTNNVLERFFRRFKKQQRRKGGAHSMTKFLRSTLPDSPLIANLCNPAYLRTVLGNQPSLAARFAQVDIEKVRQTKETKDPHKVPLKLRILLRQKNFLELLFEGNSDAASPAPLPESVDM